MQQQPSKYTRPQFVSDIKRARRGARVLYHVGLLMFDRMFDKDANLVGWAAWDAYVEGLCTLVQKRVVHEGIPLCEYYAVRL